MMDEELGRSTRKSDHPGKEKRKRRDELYSKPVRAGKRTYFFDVKTTRRNDWYVVITESKKRTNRDGRIIYEKHKIFLYQEDFENFRDGLAEALDFVNENFSEENVIPKYKVNANRPEEKEEVPAEEFTSVEFEDLGEK